MPSLPILVLNSGSSSIKFSIYEAGDGERTRLLEGAVDGIGTDLGKFWIKDEGGNKLVDQTPALPNRAVAFKIVADALHSGDFPAPAAIGHRTVCGGPTVRENQLITPRLIDEIDSYAALAPLHTPIAVYIMREALRLFPGTPNFAILDTYFHRTIPEVAARMPIPDEYVALGVRRYGYHGISYESIIYQLQPNVPEKLIVAHLGNGASISAIRGGKCLDTSMALTPTSGIISGSRTGDIDPGVLIFILKKIAETTSGALDAAEKLENVVSKQSGLLGVSGLSNDMRDLRESIQEGNARARLAVDKFTWTIARWIGSYVAELNGLDMLVFTGGIGENDIASRAEICAGLGALGIVVDPVRNNVRGEAVISAESSPVTVRVIPPAEDLIIVNHVVRLLATPSAELSF
ncbi:MAG: acetate/propionate family kinase [Terracidiphilus sp.]|nr:acetate/propionate family kinase [Terracidiphilus sp.]